MVPVSKSMHDAPKYVFPLDFSIGIVRGGELAAESTRLLNEWEAVRVQKFDLERDLSTILNRELGGDCPEWCSDSSDDHAWRARIEGMTPGIPSIGLVGLRIHGGVRGAWVVAQAERLFNDGSRTLNAMERRGRAPREA
jgi:hypothetical protein